MKWGKQRLPHLFLKHPSTSPYQPTLPSQASARVKMLREKGRQSRDTPETAVPQASTYSHTFPGLPYPTGSSRQSAEAEGEPHLVRASNSPLGTDPRALPGSLECSHPPCWTAAELWSLLHEGFPECFPEDIVPHYRVIRVKFITSYAGPCPTQWGRPALGPSPASPGKCKPALLLGLALYQPWRRQSCSKTLLPWARGCPASQSTHLEAMFPIFERGLSLHSAPAPAPSQNHTQGLLHSFDIY